PGSDLSGRRGPSHRVRDMRLDLAHALVSEFEHALVPFRVEHARAGFERDLFGKRTHFSLAAGLIADVDRCRVAAARAPRQTAHAAETVEIMVDARHAEFDAID